MEQTQLKDIFIKEIDGIDFRLKIEPKGSTNKTRLEYNYPDPISGKKIRKKFFKGFTSKKTEKQLIQTAHRTADTLAELIAKGWSPVTGAINDKKTLTENTNILDCITAFRQQKKEEYDNNAITKNTHTRISIVLNHFQSWLEKNTFQHRKPSSFTYTDIKNFFDSKTNECNWGKETFNTYRNDLKAFWIYLTEKKVIPDYKLISKVALKNTRNDSSVYRVYEDEELKIVTTLLQADKAFFNLLVAAKLLYKYNIRLEEQLKLQVQDYNPKTKILTLPPSKTKNGNEAKFLLDYDVTTLFDELLGGYPEPEFYILGRTSKPQKDRLAYGALGQRWRKFRKKYKYALDDNGNPTEQILIPDDLKFYALKHTSSFYALEDGETLAQLQKRLRHVLESTTRRYTENSLSKKPITASINSRF